MSDVKIGIVANLDNDTRSLEVEINNKNIMTLLFRDNQSTVLVATRDTVESMRWKDFVWVFSEMANFIAEEYEEELRNRGTDQDNPAEK